ncbi:Fe-S-containing protein [Methanococcoides alaskense]|uniref:Nitrite reductase/ring-hydroxylating ferredoxin subunit n=1 Tax=Methanococcoides alaskense TaxID=325778 RepID=A0AA90TY22_9EURY|nr:Fe-S-containing protein [Methanococcoides alaskense]MDA0524905.1 Fe-S-containing protein [Methanococcoides alaskense]MDR6222180.1 nitrite reductase/ring-hydroxylating ferredoxin subunit [Methanococcoides alaskense]
MNSKLIGTILLIMIAVAFVPGCLENNAQAETAVEPVAGSVVKPIAATWIDPEVSGNIVTIPVQAIEENVNTHFKVNADTGEIAVMAYKLGDDIIVRSNVCPPCGSIGFSLDKDVLVCDSCRTTFDANNGEGIQGSCVAYPKENIPYTISNGNVVMELDNIVAAHLETVQRG